MNHADMTAASFDAGTTRATPTLTLTLTLTLTPTQTLTQTLAPNLNPNPDQAPTRATRSWCRRTQSSTTPAWCRCAASCRRRANGRTCRRRMLKSAVLAPGLAAHATIRPERKGPPVHRMHMRLLRLPTRACTSSKLLHLHCVCSSYTPHACCMITGCRRRACTCLRCAPSRLARSCAGTMGRSTGIRWASGANSSSECVVRILLMLLAS